MGKMNGEMEEEGDMPMMGGMMEMEHHGMGMMHGHEYGMMGDEMKEGMMGADHHTLKCLAHLGLDEKQKEAVKGIKQRVMKETIKKKADQQIARIELKDLLEKDPVDMTAVEAKLKQSEALRTDILLSHIKAKEEIKAQLTPEQRKKLKEMEEKGPMMEKEGMMRHGGDEEETETQPSEEQDEAPAPEHMHHF
jgi:Spy/CpxP family protein refolding chaperone